VALAHLAIRKVEAEAVRKAPTRRSRGRLRRRACLMATIFHPATKGSRLRRTEMIGRRLCRADEDQYSCPARPMIATTRYPGRRRRGSAVLKSGEGPPRKAVRLLPDNVDDSL
jgi:hypothetical protein